MSDHRASPEPPPNAAEEMFRRADAARRSGRLEAAVSLYRRAIEASPLHATATQHLGALLTVLGRRDEAEPVLRQAVALRPADPAARHALGTTLLAQGRYAEAGPYYRARFELPQLGLVRPSGLSFPEWRGEDLSGERLVVIPEMGFGDQIQHARFAALLRDRGVQVVLFSRPELVSLFAQSLPGVAVAAAQGRTSLPQARAWAMSGDLMFLTGVSPETLPPAPYLTAAPAPRQPEATFRVGLITAGDPKHPNDLNRSLPPDLSAKLGAELPGEVVDLAPSATGVADFAATAAIVAALDLIVTVDTAVAHLAGALGKRALVLIPGVNTDWRWMQERTDSPWYPSLTLYRADPAAGWAPAIERLLLDAHALAHGAD